MSALTDTITLLTLTKGHKMNCFSCKDEFGLNPYVVMPLLNANSCMNCWTIGEEMYTLLLNNHIRGN